MNLSLSRKTQHQLISFLSLMALFFLVNEPAMAALAGALTLSIISNTIASFSLDDMIKSLYVIRWKHDGLCKKTHSPSYGLA